MKWTATSVTMSTEFPATNVSGLLLRILQPLRLTALSWMRWLSHRVYMSCQTVMLFTFDHAFSVSSIFRFKAVTVIETKDAFMNASWVAGNPSF